MVMITFRPTSVEAPFGRTTAQLLLVGSRFAAHAWCTLGAVSRDHMPEVMIEVEIMIRPSSPRQRDRICRLPTGYYKTLELEKYEYYVPTQET